MRKPETIAREMANVEKLAASAQEFSARFPDDQYLQMNLLEYAYRKQRLAAELKQTLATQSKQPFTNSLRRFRIHLQAYRAANGWTDQQLAEHVGVSEELLKQVLAGRFDNMEAHEISVELLKTGIAVALTPLPTGAAQRPARATAVYHPNRIAPESILLTPDFECVYG